MTLGTNTAASAWRVHAEHETRGFTEVNRVTINERNAEKLFFANTKGLYSEPVPSMVRELICNALDESPYASRRLRVELPTSLAPVFVVRDWGRGMTHDFVMTQAMSLGESTKENDADALGKFGLGLKVGFALCDQFTITIYRGHEAQAYVTDLHGGLPRVMTGPDMIRPLAVHETGTEIRVPVPIADAPKIRDAMQLFLAQIDPALYEACGVHIEPMEWTRQTPSYNTFSGNEASFILLGPVRYPINWGALGMQSHNGFGTHNAAFKFGGGEIHVIPNREQVRYTEQTVEAIKSKLAILKADLEKECAAAMAVCTTRLEAFKAAEKLRQQFGSLFPGVVWGVEDYSEQVLNPAYDAWMKRGGLGGFAQGPDEPQRYLSEKKQRPWKVPQQFNVSTEQHWSVNDLRPYKSPKSTKDEALRINTYNADAIVWVENDINSNRITARVKILAEKHSSRAHNVAVITQETAKLWGLYPVIKLSTIDPPAIAKSSGKVTTGERTAYRLTQYGSYRAAVRVDVGGLYVPFIRGNMDEDYSKQYLKLLQSAYGSRREVWGLPEVFRKTVAMEPWKDAGPILAADAVRDQQTNAKAIAWVRAGADHDFLELCAHVRGNAFASRVTPSAQFNKLRAIVEANQISVGRADLVQALIELENAGVLTPTPPAVTNFAQELAALRKAQPVFAFVCDHRGKIDLRVAALTLDK